MATNQNIGQKGEELAVGFLEGKGYRVLDRNYRFERSEIDIVAFDPDEEAPGGELVFAEVKTRTGLSHGTPDEAVSEEKQASIAEVSRAWLHERRMEGAPCRFDVVSVVLVPNQDPTIEHFENAFLA